MNTGDDEEALDLVQDAMFTLVRKYADRPENELPPLFHTILYSKINDWHRKQKVRNRWRVFFNYGSDEQQGNIEDNTRQELYKEPEADFEAMEDIEQLSGFIKKLPPRQQQALVLRAWEGYSVAETAKIMKCSEGSVKTHFSRAVHTLRDQVERCAVENSNESA
jgi:RNA polymerase sigma-70 factor (ECF subfamily)